MKIPAIQTTLTGADERTPLAELLKLAAWPHVEIGLLYTFAPEGRNRYPSLDWLHGIAPRLSTVGRLALHVCGGRARRQLMDGELADLFRHAQRLQVNGTLQPEEVEHICSLYPGKTIITQHCTVNAALVDTIEAKNHALLVDGSGGRGVSPTAWVRPATAKAVGFAGGLGSENIIEQRPLIAAVATGQWWIDMEGRLRDSDDCFDVQRALTVARITQAEPIGISLQDFARLCVQ